MSTISSNINTGAKYEILQHSTESFPKTVNNGSDTIITNDTSDILDISAEAQNILNETQSAPASKTIIVSGKKYYNQLKDYGLGIGATKKFTEYQGDDVYDEFGNLVDFSQVQDAIMLVKWNSNYEEMMVIGQSSGAVVLSPPSSPTPNSEMEAQMNRAYEANYKSYQEFFDEYLQTQKNTGKKIIEHSAFSNDLLIGNTVDEYGYNIIAKSDGWAIGNGYAIQNPDGDPPPPPKKPSVVRGQDGMYYYGFYIDPSMLKHSRVATLITENATPNSPTDTVISFWSKDSVNLPGLTLTQRKNFLETTQAILNNSGINVFNGNTLEVLEQSFVFRTQNGQTEIYLDQIKSGLSQEDHERLKTLLSNNKTLSSLAEISMKNRGNPSNTGNYRIFITDSKGNVLEQDQLRLEANGQSALASVQQYEKMTRAEIIAYVAKNGK
jgi:hypothetical protein